MNATTEPHTAAQERDQQVGHAEPLAEPVEAVHGDHGGSSEPPATPPPVTHGRGDGRPGRPPLWWKLQVLGCVLLLLGMLLFVMARPEQA